MDEMRRRMVTVTHSHSRELADQVKKLLEYSGCAQVVVAESPATGGLSGIAAAVGFDDGRTIVIARRGVDLSEALRGVAVVRYSGDYLDASATLAVLAAIKDSKCRPMSAAR